MRLAPLATTAALLIAAAPAHAGSYDVAMCGAPGGGGVNRSWVPEKASFGADPGPYYQFDTTCDGGLAVYSTPQDGLRAPWLTFADWVFKAPAGTEITNVVMWRYGDARDDRAENGTDDDHWQIYAHDDTGNQIGGGFGGDTCSHGNGVPECTIGSPTGIGDASRSEHRVASSWISWGVICGGAITDGCQTSYGIPLVSLTLYGAIVTLSDASAPAVSPGGPLLAGGWRPASDPVSFDASDNAGIRAATLQLDGATVDHADFACDYTVPVPCANVSARQLGLRGAQVGVGAHTLRLIVEDAAGNQAVTERSVQIDPVGPHVVRALAHGRTLRIRMADAGAGLADAAFEVRPSRTAAFAPLPATRHGSVFVARLPRRGAGVRAIAHDAAGNTTAGELTRIGLRAGRHAVRRGDVHVRFGRAVTLGGRLTTRDGVAVAGAPVQVLRTLRRTGAPTQLLHTLTTDAAGRFAFRAAAGPSRQLRFAAGAAGDALSTARGVSVRVAAATSIHATPRALAGAGTVTFSGALRTLGQRVPRAGKLIDLQAFDAGRWRTFATARARGARARWRLRYGFSGRSGAYPVRARIRREAVWPFDLGYSRSVVVRVG